MNALDSLNGELTSAYLYRVIAICETEPRKRRLFEELARDAEQQATHWAEAVRNAGTELAPFRPTLRARLVATLVRLLGARRLTHVLVAMKVRGMSVYTFSPTPQVPSHAEGLPSAHEEVVEHRHTEGGGSLRAAVFGVNDGLVSNASLILGVAGAGTDNATVLLAGVAGMLAGAFSMAAGEYVSVRSQREMYEYQIALEQAELIEYPMEEAEELARIFEARGVAPDEARRNALQLIGDPERALEALTREELGLNPADLGSPYGAAIASFLAFAIGSALPLIPLLLTRGTAALIGTIAVSAAALYAVGAATSLFTGRPAYTGGLRMLALGTVAGMLTFSIGRLLGVSLA
ncbi:MAG: VIT1/CCC1 transporter family protein [Betaproteobacteria bacterium]|nr:VIT1/CCC1 transporter family protein [Betaproteobacteria bacterium]